MILMNLLKIENLSLIKTSQRFKYLFFSFRDEPAEEKLINLRVNKIRK